MNRKEALSGIIEFLTPEGQQIPKAAQCSCDVIPTGTPAVATLEFEMTTQKLLHSINDSPIRILDGQNEFGSDRLAGTPIQLSFPHQLRIKCAELWMKLGEADEGVRELQGLPHSAWKHPAVTRARLGAIAMLRGANKQT